MVFGMSLSTYTTVHVIISLIAIVDGLHRGVRHAAVEPAWLRWTAIFLWTTVLTSVTGFGFPFDQRDAGHRRRHHFAGVARGGALRALRASISRGAWRWIYVVSAIVALWFNVFVLIVQSFQKIASLKALAPTQSEPPFQIAQGAALVLFVALAILAVRKFQPACGIDATGNFRYHRAVARLSPGDA